MINRYLKYICLGFAVILLSACATSARQELNRGKQRYEHRQYALSYIHLSKAAEAGNADAQYALGYMYYYGKGVDQDSVLAEKWITKSAQQGHPLAIKALQMLQTANHNQTTAKHT